MHTKPTLVYKVAVLLMLLKLVVPHQLRVVGAGIVRFKRQIRDHSTYTKAASTLFTTPLSPEEGFPYP